MRPPRLTLLLLFSAVSCCVFSSGALGQAGPGPKGARLFKSGPIQITADGAFVWSVNPDNDSVSRLETATGALSEYRLPAGLRHNPKGLSTTEDGREIWVACHDSDRLLLLSGTDGALLATIELPWGSGPYSVALSPDGATALVTLHRAEAAALVSVAKREVTQMVEGLFWAPTGVAWTEAGSAAWINHIFAPGEHPLQTRLEFSSGQARVTTAMRITPADPRMASGLAAPYAVPEGGYLNVRGHGAQIPPASGRNQFWMPTQYHNFNTDSYSIESSIQSAIRHIDLAKRTLLNDNQDKVVLSAKYVHKAVSGGVYEGPGWDAPVAGPVDLAFSHDGAMVYLLHELSGDLVAMPSSTPPVKPANSPGLPRIKVGQRPIGVAVSPSAPRAYVNNQLSRDISVVDLASLQEISRVPATPSTGERFSEPALLGAKIFHSSGDPRISANGKVACASCHINGEHDGRSWSFQNLPGKHGPRAVPSMLGLALGMGPKDPVRGWGQLHRSGDRDEVQDFEHTFRNIQMGGAGFLGAAAKPELGEPNAGLSPELDGLAAYLLTLEPLRRSPRRVPGGALSEAASRGATFFMGANRAQKPGDAGCAACHVPETGFQDYGFHDVGQQRDATEKELNSRTPAWHVNTPTLVGLWATPPYEGMAQPAESHSAEGGMVAFLLDAARRGAAANPHGRPDGLTSRQLRDLAEFVLSIDGNMTAEEARGAGDSIPPRITRISPTSLTRVEVWFNESIREAGAERVENWRLVDAAGAVVPIAAALWDPQNGDRVTLTTSLKPHTSYRLSVVGGILDMADAATGGTANAIDPGAADNRREFAITDRLTITLGASGRENLAIPVHDTAMVGPGLNTWSHDSLWLAPTTTTPRSTTGFIRFAWRNVFAQATGVARPEEILEAAFHLHPEFGDGARLEVRRVLQGWSDPASGSDWNSSATGAPTWRDSAHPGKRWNTAGAGKLGGFGDKMADYNGSNDLAARTDAVVEVQSMNRDVEFGGPLVTDAYRFWFANPAVDYGHAVRFASAATAQELKFERGESGLRDHAPSLRITYLLPGAPPRLEAEARGGQVELRWPAEFSGWVLESARDVAGPWAEAPAAPLSQGGQLVLQMAVDQDRQFLRLAR